MGVLSVQLSRRNVWRLGVVIVDYGSFEKVVLAGCLCCVVNFAVVSYRAVGVFSQSGMVRVVFDP